MIDSCLMWCHLFCLESICSCLSELSQFFLSLLMAMDIMDIKDIIRSNFLIPQSIKESNRWPYCNMRKVLHIFLQRLQCLYLLNSKHTSIDVVYSVNKVTQHLFWTGFLFLIIETKYVFSNKKKWICWYRKIGNFTETLLHTHFACNKNSWFWSKFLTNIWSLSTTN